MTVHTHAGAYRYAGRPTPAGAQEHPHRYGTMSAGKPMRRDAHTNPTNASGGAPCR